MTNSAEIETAFRLAKEQYESLGVNVDEALARMRDVSISVHCWQGDDVAGFEGGEGALGNGLAVTGNYPGRARTPGELRRDLEMAYSLIPGRHRLNLHALYGEFHGPVDRDEIGVEHFQGWIDWSGTQDVSLDFNPSYFSHAKASDGFTLSHSDPGIRQFWIDHGIACRKVGAAMGEALGTPCVTNVWIPDGFKDTPASRRLPRERLAEALEILQEEGRELVGIWLTHHHPDHIGGVTALRQQLDLPVSAHPETAERLRAIGISVDHHLSDEQRIVLGGEVEFPVRVLHTPGHARGHLCFYDETYGSLLAGDLVAGIGTIVIDPPDGDMRDYLESLRRVRELAPRTLFPSHGPVTVDATGKLDALIEHRLWREERVLETWRSGEREPAVIRSRVYDDIPEIAHPLANRQVIAHLCHLKATGRLID